MSATRGRWEFGDDCMAIRTSFPGCPQDLWSHGTFGVEQLEDRVEDETQDHVEFGDDAEFESEIEAIVGVLEPLNKVTRLKFLRPGRPWHKGSSIEG